jgi:hypothetical protein
MADPQPTTLLQALQYGMYTPTESPYGMAAQSIAGGMPGLYNPYASGGENLGVTIGAGLLAGLLAGGARRDAAAQNAELMPMMQQIMTAAPEDRAGIAAGNPRLSPLVQALAFDDYSQGREIQKQRAIKSMDVEFAPQIETAKLRASQPLELGQRAREGVIDAGLEQGVMIKDGTMVPFADLGLRSPEQVEIDKQRSMVPIEVDKAIQLEDAKRGANKLSPKDLAELEIDYTTKLASGSLAQSVLEVEARGRQVMDAITKRDPLNAASAIYGMAKVLDPSGVVRKEDGTIVADPGGPAGQLASLHNQILQKGQLTDQTIAAMNELVPKLVGFQLDIYDKQATAMMDAARRQGANPANIGRIPRAEITPIPNLASMLKLTAPNGSNVEIVD